LFGFVKAAKFRESSEYSDCIQNVWWKSCLPCEILYIKQKKNFCRARKSLGTSLALQCYSVLLRAVDSKYGESNDSSENSDFLLLRQKDPLGELFLEINFKSSSELTFFRNLRKFEIPLNQPKWPMEFTQNCTFSTGQYRKKGTCLDFLFTQFAI